MVSAVQVSKQVVHHIHSNVFYITAEDVSPQSPSFRSIWRLAPKTPDDPRTRIADIVTTVPSQLAVQKAVASAMPGWIPVQRIQETGTPF